MREQVKRDNNKNNSSQQNRAERTRNSFVGAFRTEGEQQSGNKNSVSHNWKQNRHKTTLDYIYQTDK